MGGSISATSQLGVGSQFVIELPCEVRAEETALENEAPAAPVKAGLTVLVVDDSSVNQQVAVGLLRRMAASASVASNGAEAIEILSQKRCDLVLMDMLMPGMDGLSASRALRAKGFATPFFGLTANAFESDREACLASGMNGFVAKPLTKAKLTHIFTDLTTIAPSGASQATDQRSALIEELGAETYQSLVVALVEDGHTLIDEARASGDSAVKARTMHSLKGMALTLGFEDLGNLAAALEQDAKNSRPVTFDKLTQIIHEVERNFLPRTHGALGTGS